MTLADITYRPGTQKSPQQTEISQVCFTETDHVHFPDGNLTTLPAYVVTDAVSEFVELLGAVRSIHAHKFGGMFPGSVYIAGSNTRLYAIKQSNLYNITPFADQKGESLGNDPLSTTSADATMEITWVAHGLSVGDSVTFSGATDVGGVDAALYINIEHRVTAIVSDDIFRVELAVTASSTATGGGDFVIATSIGRTAVLGTDPLSVVDTQDIMTVTYNAHGLEVGDRIKLTGATDFGGLDAGILINIEHIVATVLNANTFTVILNGSATSTASGGGTAVSIFTPMAIGFIDQNVAIGYGVGIYGEGIYGIGGEAQGAQVFPRIWSMADFGDSVVMCPGDYMAGDGQKIYVWDGNLNQAPTIAPNAPTDCNWVDVINNCIAALRGNLIQIAGIGSLSDWDGLTSYLQEVQSVWKLVSTQTLNEKEACIFAPNEVLRLRYVGGADIWDLSDLFADDGIIAPNAACLLNSAVYWRGSRGAYVHTGSFPVRIKNIQNDDWIKQNINMGQAWKCFAMANPENSEWYFYFPSGADNEPEDYVIHNIIGFDEMPTGSFTLGVMPRTAAQRPSALDSQFYMINSTSESVAGTPYLHFTTSPVTFSWTATTSEQYILSGEYRAMIDQVFPDSNQAGNVFLKINTREYAQGILTVSDPYTIAPNSEYVTVSAGGKLFGLTVYGNVQFTMPKWKMNFRKLGRR
jgi:hypothetical protein